MNDLLTVTRKELALAIVLSLANSIMILFICLCLWATCERQSEHFNNSSTYDLKQRVDALEKANRPESE